jgi:hypothetical protein
MTYADNFPLYIPDGTEETLQAYSNSIIKHCGNNRTYYRECRDRLKELVDYMDERLEEKSKTSLDDN